MDSANPVGKTKTQGWEIGVRRTFPINTREAWEVLTTQPGLGCWLGTGITANFQKGDVYRTKEHVSGDIRSFAEGSLIRLTWQPPEWDFVSTLQLRVTPAKRGATISFHHEKMESGEQRAAMHAHWSAVLDKLGEIIQGR